MKFLILTPLLCLTVVGTGFYYLETFDISMPKNTISIVRPKGAIDNGLLSRKYYMEYSLLPTEHTKSETVYRIAVDNGSVRREDKVVWSQLELDIGKPKTLKHEVSVDEMEALRLHPLYSVSLAEVKSVKSGTYLMWPILYVLVLALVSLMGVSLFRKPMVRPTPVNTFTRPRTPQNVTTDELSDEELAKRCFTCSNLKSVNGIFRCTMEKCKY